MSATLQSAEGGGRWSPYQRPPPSADCSLYLRADTGAFASGHSAVQSVANMTSKYFQQK